MFRRELKQYKRRLLKGGMAWGAVHRHLRELEDHHRDLQDRARAEGLEEEPAANKAGQQIGNLDVLAAHMLASAPRSLWRRHPVTMNVWLPLLSLLLCYFLTLMGLVVILESLESNAGVLAQVPQWLRQAMTPFRWFVLYVLPLLIALPLVRFARRSYVPPRYWVSGVLLLCLLGSGINFQVAWPDPEAGRLGAVSGQLLYPGLLSWNCLRLALNLLLIMGFAWRMPRSELRALHNQTHDDNANDRV